MILAVMILTVMILALVSSGRCVRVIKPSLNTKQRRSPANGHVTLLKTCERGWRKHKYNRKVDLTQHIQYFQISITRSSIFWPNRVHYWSPRTSGEMLFDISLVMNNDILPMQWCICIALTMMLCCASQKEWPSSSLFSQINTFGGKCLPKTIWIPTTRENSERSELATFVCIWQSSHTSLGVF